MRIVSTGMLCLAIFVISASGRGLRASPGCDNDVHAYSPLCIDYLVIALFLHGSKHLTTSSICSLDSSVLDPPSGLKSNKPVVVTQAFCNSVFASIKSKTQPYWDVEAQKCNVETRTELVEQCSVIIAEFRKQLADVCPPMEPCTENCNKFKPGPLLIMVVYKLVKN